MAKLPSDESLGQMPGAAYSRPIATVDYSPETTGLSNLGKGISDVGGGIVTYAKEQDRKAGVLDEARATSAYLTARVKHDEERQNIGSEADADAHGKGYEENLARQAALIRDPQRREQFLLRYKPDVASSQAASRKQWEKVDTDQVLAGADQTVEDMRKAAAKADEPTRAAAIRAQAKLVDDLVESGYITAVEGVARKKRYAEQYAEAAIGALPPSQRVAALTAKVEENPAVKQSFKFFRDMGWSAHQAAGIIGNLLLESGGKLDPNARNPGDGRGGSDSIGIGQWNSDRAVALKKFAADRGKPWNDLGVQLAFVQAELDGREGKAAERLRQSQSVSESTGAFLHYERPKGYEGGLSTASNGANRLGYAQRVYSAFSGDKEAAIPGGSVVGVIPENRRRDLLNGASREVTNEMRQREQEIATEKATVNQMIQDDHSSILNTGTPMPDLTPERVGAALGPAKQQEFLQNREQAQRYHDATRDWSSIPSSEIQARVETLKPAGGTAGFAAQQKYYESAQKAAQTIIKARESDPAAAVNTFEDVKKASQAVNANDPASVAALARARLKAQEVIGIPAANRMPITKQEAAALGKPIFNAPEGSGTIEAIKTVLPFIDKAYGPYADKVLEFALTEAGLDDKVAKQAHAMMRKLQRGEPLTPGDATAIQTTQTNAAQKEAAGGFDPFGGDYYSVPEKTPQVRTIPPSAITALRQNPAMIGDFMRKYGGDAYGQGAAAKAAEALGIKVPKAEK